MAGYYSIPPAGKKETLFAPVEIPGACSMKLGQQFTAILEKSAHPSIQIPIARAPDSKVVLLDNSGEYTNVCRVGDRATVEIVRVQPTYYFGRILKLERPVIDNSGVATVPLREVHIKAKARLYSSEGTNLVFYIDQEQADLLRRELRTDFKQYHCRDFEIDACFPKRKIPIWERG